MTLSVYDEFCGVGGTSFGASLVPGVQIVQAANHDPAAIASHALNFPTARHYQADVTKLDVTRMPRVDLFLASPVCPPWTDANGVRRDFDTVNSRQTLFGDAAEDDNDYGQDPKLRARREKYRRARLLMNEVVRYLRAVADRGRPVLAGLVENVVQCRLWDEWDRWHREIRALGYDTRLIAFNSMHARPVRTLRAPQSRDRLYLAYWHRSLRRTPDFDKWLRPRAHCSRCGRDVDAVQVWKQPGRDMGRYRAQYVYRCPAAGHRDVVPDVLPALVAIDPTLPGIRIGDRAAHGLDPLAAATLARIAAGIHRYWAPLLTPVGGAWRTKGERGARPLTWPMPTGTTRETDGIAVPPLLVPVEGRPGKTATSADRPMRTQTTRNETGHATLPLPFLTPLRGGGDKQRARPVTDPLSTITAGGNHHGLALPPLIMRNNTVRGDAGQMVTPADQPLRTITTTGHQSLLTWHRWAQSMLVPYYGKAGPPTPATGPVGTLTTRDRYGLAQPHDGALFHPAEQAGPAGPPGSIQVADLDIDLDDVLFRMLEPHEIARAMAFPDTYLVSPAAKRAKVRLYGNAVTPPVAEVIVSALVEALTGEPLEAAA